MDKEKEQLLRKNLMKFSEVIKKPSRVFRFFSCLNSRNKEKLLAVEQTQGGLEAFFLFHRLLTTRPGWFKQLVLFLRDEEEGNEELANILDPTKEYTPEIPVYSESTPLNELPHSVLGAISLLHSLSAINTWKMLASKLGFSLEEVGIFEAKPNPVLAFYQHFMEKDSATLGVLLTNLKDMEREDVLSELESRLRISVTDIIGPATLPEAEEEDKHMIEEREKVIQGSNNFQQTKKPHQQLSLPVKENCNDNEAFQFDFKSKKLDQQQLVKCNMINNQKSTLELVFIDRKLIIGLSICVLAIALIFCFLIT